MADTIARLNVVCGATDQASGILSGITGKIMALGAAAGLIGGLAFIGKKSLDSFIEFDTAISKSMMMFDDFGEDVRGEVESTSRALSKELGYSAAEVAEGFYALGSAGISAADSLSMIEDITRFAMASGGELGIEEASETAMTAMKAFGKEASDVPHILDVMAYAGKKTNTNLSDLSQAFAYVAPAAGSFGMTVEEVSAALGMMSDVGIKGSAAGTALRRIITNLVAPTGQAAQAIEALNLQVYETGSSGNDLISSIASCQDEMDGYQMTINETTAALLGLEDAQRGFNIDLQELMLEKMRIEDRAKDEGRDYTKAEMDRLEEIESARRDLNISMKENQIESLKLEDQQKDTQSAMEDLTLEIEDQQIELEDAGGEMRDFADILKDIEEGASDMSPEMRNATLTMLAGVRGISGLMSLLGDGGDAYATFTGEMEEADGLVREMSEFMATSAGVKMDIFRQHINDLAISLGEKLFPWVEKVVQFFYDNEETIKSVGNWFLTIASAVASLLTGDWSGFKEKATSAMSTLWQAIKDFDWGGAWDTLISELSGIAKSVWNWITTYDWGGAWDTLIAALSGIAKAVWDWITTYDWGTAWDNLISGLSGIAGKIYNWISEKEWDGVWDDLYPPAKEIIDAVCDALNGGLGEAIKTVKWEDIKKEILDQIGNISIQDVVFHFLWPTGGWGFLLSKLLGPIDFSELGKDIGTALYNAITGISFQDIVSFGAYGGWGFILSKLLGDVDVLGSDIGKGLMAAVQKGIELGLEVFNIPSLASIGQGIISSLESGFRAAWNAFATAYNMTVGLLGPKLPMWGSGGSVGIGLGGGTGTILGGNNQGGLSLDNTGNVIGGGSNTFLGGNASTSDILSGSIGGGMGTIGQAIGGGMGSFSHCFDDFVLSGGRAFEFNPRDTLIGTKTPGQIGGGKTYHIIQNLTFTNVADEQYIHKIGSMVQKSLERVIA